MPNNYETVFILTPVLSEAQTKEAVATYKKVLVDNGATIITDESWGLRKLAYPIQKKSTGFYHLFHFECEGDLIGKLETQYRRDEQVMRFLTMRMDKHAIAYAAKRKIKVKETKKAEAAS